MGKNRIFTIGFKQQVVSEIESGQLTAAEACRRHVLHSSVVSKWQRRFALGTLQERPSITERDLCHQVEKLQAKVGELTMENDLLKKFQSWVQRRRKESTCVITEKNLAQFVGGAKCSE